MDKKWALPPCSREQHLLFPTMLDEIVPANHAIRLLDALLNTCDWTSWELHYDGHRGQPPIHPRLMSGCILYGLLRGIRSSRGLEDATRERKDYMWFLEGRTIDHTTFAIFRTAYSKELKDLHRQIARMIFERTQAALEELVLDGTRERANSDRHGARSAQTIERMIQDAVAALDRKLDEMARADQASSATPGQQSDAFDETPAGTPSWASLAQGEAGCGLEPAAPPQTASAKTPEEMARLQHDIARQHAKAEHLQKALDAARERDETKKKLKGQKATPTRVPITDPDAYVLPNKEGGHAPNYTTGVAVDGASGAIVHGDVVPGADEGALVLPAIEEAKAIAGVTPERVVADGNVIPGKTMQELEKSGIEVYAPTGTDFRDSNPANRPGPEAPVPESQCAQLPHRGKYFAQAAFVYDAEKDGYYCPAGETLHPSGNAVFIAPRGYRQQYTCPGKAGCPFAKECVPEKTPARKVVRDEYQDTRDEIGRRMATPEGQKVYKRRAPTVEGVFARIKHHMGIRRFLLRGLDKVRMEWSWVCVAYNLKLLMRIVSSGVQSLVKGGGKPDSGPLPGKNTLLTVQFGARMHDDRGLPIAA